MKMRLFNMVAVCLLMLSMQAYSQKMNKDIERAFKKVVSKYAADEAVADRLWLEVTEKYTGTDRYYHNMEHLENFYTQLGKCKHLVKDADVLLVAMVYHDIIYNSEDHKDEERSAVLAVQRLKEAGFPADQISKCEQLILATKTHAHSPDMDTNLFNDADMTILGLDRPVYDEYVKNVRKEYGNSPQFDTGRKRVLQYFLGMERIFKTDFFYQLYESAARENINHEIGTL